MAEFISSELGSLIKVLIDYRGKTPKKLNGVWSDYGIPALSAKNIKQGKIVNEKSIRFVSEDLYKKWMHQEVKSGDILMTSEAPLGETYFMKTDEKLLLSQRLFAIRIDSSKIDSKYLYYYFNTDIGRYELQSRATGTTVGGIRQTALYKTIIRHPKDIRIQNKISSFLTVYDELIENNEKRIKILEEMAQRLYTEWFVKFKYPGYEKSKVHGGLPENWSEKSFYEVVYNFDSKRKPISSLKRRNIQGNIPYYGAAKIIDYVDDYIFDGRYLLIAEDGSVVNIDGKPVLQFVDERFWVSNHAHIVQGNLISTEVVYLRMCNLNIRPLITGAAQPKITKDNLSRVMFAIPDSKTKGQFEEFAMVYFNEIFNLKKQIKILNLCRDLLIPQLVTGRRQLKND